MLNVISFFYFCGMSRILKEELTTAMHSDFFVSEETQLSHRVCTVVEVVSSGAMLLSDALALYDVSLDDYNRFRSLWSPVK